MPLGRYSNPATERERGSILSIANQSQESIHSLSNEVYQPQRKGFSGEKGNVFYLRKKKKYGGRGYIYTPHRPEIFLIT